ncbi:MAG: peptidase S9, partial [Muribaculaceae bacterium]|nr:peptidase S9 [Muribaculaceae bacterium]
CAGGGSGEDEKIIDRPDFKSESGIFDIDALEALGRVTEPVVSPDGTKILFGISYESVEQNTSNRDLYVIGTDGTNQERITHTAKSENNAVWIDGGKRIAFIYPVEGKGQLWVMNADGSDRKVASNVENGISGFKFSPDGKKVVMIGNVKYARTAQDIYPDLPKATGRVVDDLMYKHWDEWVTEIPHPFIADFDGSTVSNVEDIMADEPYEAPMKPFGGAESFAWSPDSKTLVYVSRKKTGLEYSVSTNSDLYAYNVDTKETRNLTEGMMGYDTAPAFSPDGNYLAWLSMEHDGYESDKNRLFILDMQTSEKSDLTAEWDYTIEEFAWAPDGRTIFFLAYRDGVKPMFNIALDRTISVVAQGECDYESLNTLADGSVVTMAHSMLRPNEIYKVTDGNTAALTDVNGEIFSQLTMPTVEKRMVPTTDGKEMLTWVILPPNFDANKKYPSI